MSCFSASFPAPQAQAFQTDFELKCKALFSPAAFCGGMVWFEVPFETPVAGYVAVC
jgi:hypothetical protein